jgi:hypothetical protein
MIPSIVSPYIEKRKEKEKEKETPNVGLEPTTLRLRVSRSTD